MKNKRGKIVIASFELILLTLSIFAFSYFISETENYFENPNEKPKFSLPSLRSIKESLQEKLTKPMIPVVSAADSPGCCILTSEGVPCVTTMESVCPLPSENFHNSLTCSNVPACQIGCCYNEATGVFDSNVIGSECNSPGWTFDPTEPNCNLPKATYGCCYLENGVTEWLREGECNTYSQKQDLDSVDWRTGVAQTACTEKDTSDELGACKLESGECSLTTHSNCPGDYYRGFLCTSPKVASSCERTTETMCYNERVYFKDSCENHANIYDSTKVNDDGYWNTIYSQSDSCDTDSLSGNAESTTCGNCNKYLGGICALAPEDSKMEDGNYYCKPTTCLADTNQDGIEDVVRSEESWCLYEGNMSDGNAVVGSEYFLQSCIFGEVITVQAGNYREKVCVGINIETEELGTTRTAEVVQNNAGNCPDLNSGADEDEKEENMQKCKENPGCMLYTVDVSEHFNFTACVPKYPEGFDLKSEKDRNTEALVCGSGSAQCYVPIDWEWDDKNIFKGRCVVQANAECMTEEFTTKMNEYCRRLGDCGGEVNYNGVYSQSFKVSGKYNDTGEKDSVEIGGGHIDILSDNVVEILEEFAEDKPDQDINGTEYITYVAKAWGAPENYNPSDLGIQGPNIFGIVIEVLSNIAGGSVAGGIILKVLEGSTLTLASQILGPISGALVGAAAAYRIGVELGLEGDHLLLVTVAGGLIGGGAMLMVVTTNFWNPVGWVAIGVAVSLILFVWAREATEKNCLDYIVTFECKPWSPPSGGDDCDLCNEEEFGCTKYKCNSLGAACELLNEGTEYEKCEAIPDDEEPPIISPGKENDFYMTIDGETIEELNYEESNTGYIASPSSGGECFDANTDVFLAVKTNEPTICKFSTDPDFTFEEGNYFGLNQHTNDSHLLLYKVPDPSEGTSRGLEYTGSSDIFVKCQDFYGDESPGRYTIKICANQGEDITTPRIKYTSPKDNSLVGFDVNEKEIEIFTSELSDCKWSLEDKSYEEMEYSMQRYGEVFISYDVYPGGSGYRNTATVNTSETENAIYINCLDQPWLAGTEDESKRNDMSQNEVLHLNKPATKIEIDSITPDEDYETSTKIEEIDLKIKTSGGGNYHWCKWSLTGYEIMHDIDELGTLRTHEATPLVSPGKQKIYVECFDETGDIVQGETEFEVIYDGRAPLISRVWQDSGKLNIVTNEIATCKYSKEKCAFDFDSEGTRIGKGVEMSMSITKGEVYYIKCEDEFGNSPSGLLCSMQVLAT